MSRAGGTSGKGGRNYRVNWKATADGGAEFGDWSIVLQDGWRLPWEIRYQGKPFQRRHGDYNGTARFKTVENAQRKIEVYLRSRRTA
jgi:hypothetical protein